MAKKKAAVKKKVAKSAAKRRTPAPAKRSVKTTRSRRRKAASGDGVVVRMFCQGLGDCFLLSIPNGAGQSYHVLIDCGVCKAAETPEETMCDVVSQIHELTGGVVDVLIVTHEHWDHVSGFIQAESCFAFGTIKADAKDKTKLHIKRVWMAWTEDPRDKLAKELRADYGKAKLALANALAAVTERNAALGAASLEAIKKGMEGILGVFGPGDMLTAAMKAAASPKAKVGTQEAMENAKKLVKGKGLKSMAYLRPGKTCQLPDAAAKSVAADIKVRVLGPPHDAAAVRKLNSTKETYHKSGHSHFGGVPWAWTAALGGLGEFDPTTEAAMPFDDSWRIDLKAAEGDSFFKDRYFDAPPDVRAVPGINAADAPAVALEASKQRRIDGDWLARGAEQLALWINSYTNNVSLVLAFELPESGKVLLFVGDAQVGNWLSWHELKFKDEDNPDEEITIQDLFARTVFYKVGHHGSHNATLREKGLELMTHPELVAMLPVDHAQATTLSYGEMPLKSLVKAINERAANRLLQLDEPWDDEPPGDWPPPMIPPTIGTRSALGAKGVQYMEYVIADV